MNTDFFLQNSVWFGAAIASGSLLAYSYWRERGLTEVLGTVGAIQLINREHGQLLDVRPAKQYANGHASGAKHIELNQLSTALSQLDSKHPWLVIGSETEAGRALKLLKGRGLRAYALEGGHNAWVQAGLPVTRD
ncbi:rhodanese-like domain-containing protein [Parvibium lacunae]|nr:rhodanese-like domain-containing protein [Parvibium lacunae]